MDGLVTGPVVKFEWDVNPARILATPLVELSRTIKNDRKPGKIPGQPSWFMGLLDEP